MLPLKDYIRLAVCRLRHFYQTRWLKMDIHPTALVSFGSRLDKVNPRGIHIGEESYIASGARILSHDYCLKRHADTRIGKRCFIGADALVLCGVTIGDNVIVGAGSVVTRNTPPQFYRGGQSRADNPCGHTDRKIRATGSVALYI